MRGESHVNMNVTTGAVIAETCFMITHIDSPDWLQTGVSAFTNFMLDNGDMPMIIFVAAGIVLYLIGGLLPDIDTPYSTLGRIIYIPVEHRTWTHAVWWPIAFCAAGLKWRLLVWLGLGVLMHDLWDKPSASGVNMLYPIKFKGKKKDFKKKRIKLYYTGKGSEYMIVGVGWVLTILYSLVVVQCVYHILNISFA